MGASVSDNRIKKIVILGGGAAGWMAAAALAKVFYQKGLPVVLVESANIGTIGVGEATIPSMALFNQMLGIDEQEFMKKTRATFKLGIRFKDWGWKGNDYIHPFSVYGTEIEGVSFHHFWQRAYKKGLCKDLFDFSLNVLACKQGLFIRPQSIDNSPLNNIRYAYHLDALAYAGFLRGFAESRGVLRVEANVTDVRLSAENGGIQSLVLDDGSQVEGDFFFDCSGFQSLLAGQSLKTKFEDWSRYLPVDRALAVQTLNSGRLDPYTTSTAHGAGWQWAIPLQHRRGNGFVYSSAYLADDSAEELFVGSLGADALTAVKKIKFKTGKLERIWNKNCLSIGLASGFIEPLESTSIYFVQSAISKFLSMMPNLDNMQLMADRFNKAMDWDYESTRDFIILHYHASNRDDSDFWRYCRDMQIPASLENKIDLYKSGSIVFRDNFELFSEPSWLSVMHGQGLVARDYSPLADVLSDENLSNVVSKMCQVVQKCVTVMPTHEAYIEKYCKADPIGI